MLHFIVIIIIVIIILLLILLLLSLLLLLLLVMSLGNKSKCQIKFLTVHCIGCQNWDNNCFVFNEVVFLVVSQSTL